MPETMQRKLADRDMPAHSAPIPADHLSTTKVKSSPVAQQQQDAQYYASLDGASRALQTVPEESLGSSMDFVHKLQAGQHTEDLDSDHSPSSPFSPSGQSSTTISSEFSGSHSTSKGLPMFSEPDFGREEVEDDPVLRRMRSPGSFSADTAREDNVVSPTER